jgi:hypothetical protein
LKKVKTFFLIFTCIAGLSLASVNLSAADTTNTKILRDLEKRLSPAEWEYLQSQRKPKVWFEDWKEAIPWFTTAFAIMALILQQKWQTARERQTRLFEALRWFEGDTQKRSLGIALIEANWNIEKNLHKTWIAVLTNQAVYLLGKSGQQDAVHEIANLKRIINLLVANKESRSPLEKELLAEELEKKIANEGREPGLRITDQKLLSGWKTSLQ